MAALGAGSATFQEPGATSIEQTAWVETPREILERYLKFRSRDAQSIRRMFLAMEAVRPSTPTSSARASATG
jgi:hypothetical protein